MKNNQIETLKSIELVLNKNKMQNQEDIKPNIAQEKLSTNIPVGISNRHIHLSQEALDILFGCGYKLNKLKDLKQPGQYAAKEVVTIAGVKGSISNVRILGPVRGATQIEISKSDSFTLGINCPVRESGDIKGSGEVCVIGPKGSLILKENVIIAKRHIHMNEADANRLNVKNNQLVDVITSGDRGVVFLDVLVRVDKNFELECHLDTDEANACCLGRDAFVKIVDINLQKR